MAEEEEEEGVEREKDESENRVFGGAEGTGRKISHGRIWGGEKCEREVD